MPDSNPQRAGRIRRRTYLASVGAGFLSGLAGCTGDFVPEGLAAPVRGGVITDVSNQRTRLTLADDGVRHFGSSVDLADDATTALVSATYHEDADGLRPGPAYVLERTDRGWRQQATLDPDDGDRLLSFGWKGESTALSGDATTAIVGSDKADGPNGPWSGAAYVFKRTDGTWGQPSKLVPDDGDSKDFFGESVALSGDGRIALIGAWGNDHADGAGAGAAYVFERTDGAWSQRARLVPDDGDGVGSFGSSVALASDATTAVIGAEGDDNPYGENSGSAYVFQRDGDTWRQRTRLTADDGDANDFFGGSVTLAGDTAVIGAPEDEDPNGDSAGSAYVFDRSDGSWDQRAKLVAEDGDSTDLFGVAVDLTSDGARVLVGARVDEDPNGDAAGSAYVFERADGAWAQRAKLAPEDGESHDVFGRSVALAGDTALIGTSRGKAYVFRGGVVEGTREG